MNSKIMCKEDFDYYSDWHEFLEEEHVDKYEQLDDDTIIYFLDDDMSSK